jgi:ankyrin repeat protein
VHPTTMVTDHLSAMEAIHGCGLFGAWASCVQVWVTTNGHATASSAAWLQRALELSVDAGCVKSVEALLAGGARVGGAATAAMARPTLVLQVAAALPTPQCLSLLLDAVDPEAVGLLSAKDADGHTPLDVAVLRGPVESIDLLAAVPGTVGSVMPFTVGLALASGCNHHPFLAEFERRLERGHDLEMEDLLCGVATGGGVSTACTLLQRAADAGFCMRGPTRLLSVAAQHAPGLVVDVLATFPDLSVNEARTGCPPLHAAVQRDNADGATALLVLGADVNGVDPVSGWSPLGTAAAHGSVAALRVLLAHHAQPSLLRHTCLLAPPTRIQTSWGVRAQMVDLLLGAGADPNELAIVGNDAALTSPLYAVAAAGDRALPVLRSLLAGGADPRVTDTRRHPLSHAISTGAWEVARTLRAVMLPEAASSSPVHGGLQGGDDFDAGGMGLRVHERDDRGLSPLHVAAAAGRIGAVRALLRLGANVNDSPPQHPGDWNHGSLPAVLRARYWGHTPLHMALLANNCAVTEELLAAGADPTMCPIAMPIRRGKCSPQTPLLLIPSVPPHMFTSWLKRTPEWVGNELVDGARMASELDLGCRIALAPPGMDVAVQFIPSSQDHMRHRFDYAWHHVIQRCEVRASVALFRTMVAAAAWCRRRPPVVCCAFGWEAGLSGDELNAHGGDAPAAKRARQ